MENSKIIANYRKTHDLILLDIGCGPNKKTGYLGIDLKPGSGVDIAMDLDKEPLPFPDGSVDIIYTSHFLEHIENPVKILFEFNRILKHRGCLIIKVPHFTNPYAYHFTHKTYWSSFAFEQQYLDYYTKSQLVLVSKKIKMNFGKTIDYFLNYIVNIYPNLYERFFSSFIRAWEIEFKLQKDITKQHFINIK